MTSSFTIGNDRFTRIGKATYNGLPRIFWQHWIHQDRAWFLNGTKSIRPQADQEEVIDKFKGQLCEY